MTRSRRASLSSWLGAGESGATPIAGWGCANGACCVSGAVGAGGESCVAGGACANVAAAQIAEKKTHAQRRRVGHPGAPKGMDVHGRMVRGMPKLRQLLYIGFRTGTDCCTVADAR